MHVPVLLQTSGLSEDSILFADARVLYNGVSIASELIAAQMVPSNDWQLFNIVLTSRYFATWVEAIKSPHTDPQRGKGPRACGPVRRWRCCSEFSNRPLVSTIQAMTSSSRTASK